MVDATPFFFFFFLTGRGSGDFVPSSSPGASLSRTEAPFSFPLSQNEERHFREAFSPPPPPGSRWDEEELHFFSPPARAPEIGQFSIFL